jgi:hypothetical protein
LALPAAPLFAGLVARLIALLPVLAGLPALTA